MPSVLHDGVRIAYDERGEGQPLVLLMGLGLPGSVWQDYPVQWASKGYHVLALDARGTGDSDAPWPPYHMRDLAADTVAVMEDAGVYSGIILGPSFGGMVAQHVALAYPERVDGLVLASTTCHYSLPESLGSRELWLLLKRKLAPNGLTVEEAMELLAHPDSTEVFLQFRNILQEHLDAQPTPLHALLGQLYAAARHETCEQLADITVPTRLLAGGADRLIPPQNSEVLADRLPRSELRVLSQAGHIAIHKHPGALAQTVESVSDDIG